MSLFGIFSSKSNINDGVQTFKSTPGAALIDVRTPAEYAQGHIPGSVNIPLDAIDGIAFSKDTKLFVYCLSGGRSSSACSRLRSMGYDAVNIGGISAYNGPVE